MIYITASKLSPGRMLLKSPYNSAVNTKLKRYGAKWEGGAWSFDPRHEEEVRTLCARYHGTDGLNLPDCVDVRIIQPHSSTSDDLGKGGHPTDWSWESSELTLAGRRLIHGYSRTDSDGNARLEEGVILQEGRIYHTRQTGMDWTPYVIEVLDVSRAIATELMAKYPDYVEMIDRPAPHSAAAKEARYAYLNKQVATLTEALNAASAELASLQM